MNRPSTLPFVPSSVDLEPVAFGPGPVTQVGFAPPLARSPSARRREEIRSRIREFTTRAFNLTVVLVLLALTLPWMLLIALLVKLTSPGPVIFVQDRVGLNQRRGSRRRGSRRFLNDRRKEDRGGKIFKMYKFRTMYWTGSANDQVWAQKDDPRITSVGRFLRAHRLDELPQLFNVLKGDMNLVGPRPEQPDIFDRLRQTIDVYPHRQLVRPGITGWAQVNYRYDQSVKDVRTKLRYDLEYVQRRSVAKDLVVIAKTPQVMFFKQGSQ